MQRTVHAISLCRASIHNPACVKRNLTQWTQLTQFQRRQHNNCFKQTDKVVHSSTTPRNGCHDDRRKNKKRKLTKTEAKKDHTTHNKTNTKTNKPTKFVETFSLDVQTTVFAKSIMCMHRVLQYSLHQIVAATHTTTFLLDWSVHFFYLPTGCAVWWGNQ